MKIHKEDILHSLPPEWPEDLLPEIRARVEQAGRKVVVLDDDPTGTQTVHQVDVLTRWEPEDLLAAFEKPEPVVYILTNSRSFPLVEAQAMNREIYTRLAQAREQAGRDFVVASRSDSTLRGHFPEEVYALAGDIGGAFDGILLAPFFLEGGRYTIGDIHYVVEGDWLVPAAETEYARDAVFGYRQSDLRAWVSEKSGGRIFPEQVASISIEELRLNGPESARRRLLELEGGQVCVVNATSYRDLEVLVAGLLDAEAAGKRFIYRTAASFIRVRGGLSPRGLLAAQELAAWTRPGPGLVIAGSYIQKSSQQIAALQALPSVLSLEVRVEALLDEGRRGEQVRRVAAATEAAINTGQDVLIFTSRRLVTEEGAGLSLKIGQTVSSGLVEIVQNLQARPAWVIAKGGITSSDIATGGLGVQRARVLGQILPGVPAWLTGLESRWPGLLYVVFPGNVGGLDGMVEVVKILKR